MRWEKNERKRRSSRRYSRRTRKPRGANGVAIYYNTAEDLLGRAREAGESLVVPKGFMGIWEMQGDFRELVVIETEAYMQSEESD